MIDDWNQKFIEKFQPESDQISTTNEKLFTTQDIYDDDGNQNKMPFVICDKNNNDKQLDFQREKNFSTQLTSKTKSHIETTLTEISNIKQSNTDIVKEMPKLQPIGSGFSEWNEDDTSKNTKSFSDIIISRYKNSFKMQTYLNSNGTNVSRIYLFFYVKSELI